jgi:hypothetical protein
VIAADLSAFFAISVFIPAMMPSIVSVSSTPLRNATISLNDSIASEESPPTKVSI